MGAAASHGIPLFLYGQSMGSLVAMLVLSESNRSGHQIRPAGIILHSPAVAMIYASPIVRLGVAQLRSLKPRALLFRIGLISGEKPALTNNPKFDRYWGLSRDRVRPGFSWAFFDETLKLGARARTAASSMEVPVIVLTGDKDPIGTAGVGQGAFARFMRSIPAQEKERQRFRRRLPRFDPRQQPGRRRSACCRLVGSSAPHARCVRRQREWRAFREESQSMKARVDAAILDQW